jgi:hypothetical protein
VLPVTILDTIEELMIYTLTHEGPGELEMWLTGFLMEECGGARIKGYNMVRIINKGFNGP